MKRLAICLVLLVCLSLGSLAQEITVWITYGGSMGKVLQDLIDEDFTPKTGIRVNYLPEMADQQFMNKLIMAYLGGDAPDVFTIGGQEVVELALRGVIEDLRQFPDFAQATAHIYPNFMTQASFRGANYGVPGETGWTQVYYRTDIFEDAGLAAPQTWEEFYGILPRLRARGTEAYYAQFGTSTGSTQFGGMRMYFPFIYQRGSDIFSGDALRSNLDSPEAIDAFKQFTGLYTNHKLPLERPDLPSFGSGEVAYMIHLHYPYGILDAIHPQIQGQWAISEVPGTMRDGRLDRTVPASSFHYAIPKVPRDKATQQAAWEFVKWVSSPEIQARFQKGIFESPERWILTFGSEESVRTAAFRENDRAVVQRILAEARTPTPAVGGFITYRYMEFAFNRVVLQGEDPERALLKAAEESNAELRRKQQEFARFLNR